MGMTEPAGDEALWCPQSIACRQAPTEGRQPKDRWAVLQLLGPNVVFVGASLLAMGRSGPRSQSLAGKLLQKITSLAGCPAALQVLGPEVVFVGASLLAMGRCDARSLSLAGKLLQKISSLAGCPAALQVLGPEVVFVGASLLAMGRCDVRSLPLRGKRLPYRGPSQQGQGLIDVFALISMRFREGVKMTQGPHANRLRMGRYSQAGFVYLVTAVTAQRRPVFVDFTAARQLVRALQSLSLSSRAQTLAYVVMPDHFHWLMQLGEMDTLSSCVQRVKSVSTKAIGPKLWQKGFHDRAVRSEEDLRALARYVVSNPVRAGLAHSVGSYSHWDAVWV